MITTMGYPPVGYINFYVALVDALILICSV